MASWIRKLKCKWFGHKWKIVKTEEYRYSRTKHWVCSCCGEKAMTSQ